MAGYSKSRKRANPCSFAAHGCPNPAFSGMGVCRTCYGAVLYHTKRGPAHIIAYSRKLTKLVARVDTIVPARKRRRA